MPRLSNAQRVANTARGQGNDYVRLGRSGQLPRGTAINRSGNVYARSGYRITGGGGVAYVGRS